MHEELSSDPSPQKVGCDLICICNSSTWGYSQVGETRGYLGLAGHLLLDPYSVKDPVQENKAGIDTAV